MSLFSTKSNFAEKIIDPKKVNIEGEIAGNFFAGRIEMIFLNDYCSLDDFTILIGKNTNSKSLMSTETLNMIKNGQLPTIIGTNINLANDEVCHYADIGYTFKDKTITTGYTGKSSGISIRLMKGLTYRTGGSGGKAIRENQRTTYTGTLYITNKRVIYSSTNECFDKTFDKITSVTEVNDGIILQIGSTSYSIILNTHTEFVKIFNMVKDI